MNREMKKMWNKVVDSLSWGISWNFPGVTEETNRNADHYAATL